MQDPELDEDTLRLIVKLQLEDIKNLNVSRKGKHRAGEQPDPVVAAKVYEDELRLAEQFARDAAMCKSIAEAVREDGDAIMAFELVEQQARHDRKIAQSMQGVTDTRSNQQRTRHQSDSTENTLAHVDNELLERMLALSVDNMEGESSDWAASRKQETRQCDICTDFHAEYLLRKLHCDHTYCKNCLVHLFTDCLSDESLFPPRCCRHPIPLDDAKALLDPVLVGRFKARELELSTENRTYCHRPGCSTFVPAQFIVADRAICPNCRAATCTTCKSAAHDNTDCPKDENFQQFEQFAAQEGWQRCYSCRRFVELAHGCNHMSK
ncbi:ibr finger domain-containing protein [Stachybotrys elegans]|uniref:RBR-type E3 ubiquitin transferase n=1 Tax=Stachybotrys elegans TaxID=80388 RepID=A0A8K0WKE6_9HYPO|nr:ibr finger domain-containing protein [Stachybotrys elegans]